MFRASENEEDKEERGIQDIMDYGVKVGDVLVGISAAGGSSLCAGCHEESERDGLHQH